jgi:hypothetical protein
MIMRDRTNRGAPPRGVRHDDVHERRHEHDEAAGGSPVASLSQYVTRILS